MKRVRMGAILVCLLMGGVPNARGNTTALPTKVIAVFFTADWCGSCRVLKPKLDEIKRGFASQPVLFTQFDLTDDFTREQSARYSSLLGLEPLYREYDGKERGRTGFVLLIDADSRRVLGQITANLTPAEIRARITEALSAPAGSRSGMAEVNGTKLYYEAAGTGTPLVLIHGGFMDSRMWDEQIPELTKHFQVIRYDFRGAGKSARNYTEPYSPVEDLDGLLAFLGVQRAHIVGLSAGGELAINFALEKPHRTISLVAAEAGLSGLPFQGEGMEFMRKVMEIASKEGPAAGAEAFADAPVFASMKRTNPAAIPHLKKLLKENAHLLIERRRELRAMPLAANRLHDIKVPTLVLVSEFEGGYAAQVAAKLMSGIPLVKKTSVTNSGHMMNMEQPAAFNSALIDFLRTVNPPQRAH